MDREFFLMAVVIASAAGLFGFLIWNAFNVNDCQDGYVYVSTKEVRGCVPVESAADLVNETKEAGE